MKKNWWIPKVTDGEGDEDEKREGEIKEKKPIASPPNQNQT